MKTNRFNSHSHSRNVGRSKNATAYSWLHVLILLLIGQAALGTLRSAAQTCADSIPAASREAQAQLGQIGVTVAGPVPEFFVPVPPSKRQAIKGLAARCAWPEEGLSIHPLAAAGQLAMAPIGAVLGAAIGATRGEPEKRLRAGVAAICQVGNEFQQKDRMAALVVDSTNERVGPRVAAVPDTMRQESRPPLIWASATLPSGVTLAAADSDSARSLATSPSLAKPSFDTVLEITVLDHGLIAIDPRVRLFAHGEEVIGKEGVNPRLSLAVAWRVRVTRALDDAELYLIFPRYDGGCFKFSQWTANDGQLLRAELEHAYDELAERLVEKLALGTKSLGPQLKRQILDLTYVQ